MIPFEQFLVWQCPHCGYWQGKENRIPSRGFSEAQKSNKIGKLSLSCLRCRKSTKFRMERTAITVKHYWLKNGQAVSKYVQTLNGGQHGATKNQETESAKID